MFNYIDIKYIHMMSGYMERFKDVGNGTYNVRCSLCGDSKKSEIKARGYFYLSENNNYRYKCFNCAVNISLGELLREVNISLYNEYNLEIFKEKNLYKKGPAKSKKVESIKDIVKDYTQEALSDKVLKTFISISELADDHPARSYLISRSIPIDMMNQLFYCDNLSKSVSLMPNYGHKQAPEMQGIILPYYDSENKFVAFQIRNLDSNSNLRYLTYDLVDNHIHIYNYNNIKSDTPVYVFEGAFDSMCCINGTAASGSSIDAKLSEIKKKNKDVVIVYDNDYKYNVEIANQLLKIIENGYKVVLYNDMMNKYKDVNNYVKASNVSPEELTKYLERCTYNGLEAKLQIIKQYKDRGLSLWQKQNSTPKTKRQRINKNLLTQAKKDSPFMI